MVVVVNDKVVFEYILGYVDVVIKELIKLQMVFWLVFLFKVFVIGFILLLVCDGKLSWDMCLVDVLLFFKFKDMQVVEKVIVGDIFGQCVGLLCNIYDNMFEDDVFYEELVCKFDEVDMMCGFGQCYGYQNVVFSLIGDVIYVKIGDFFYCFVDKCLFYLLGMKMVSYGCVVLEVSLSWVYFYCVMGYGQW